MRYQSAAILSILVLGTWPSVAGGQQARPELDREAVRGGVSVVHVRQPNGTQIGANMVVFEDPDGMVVVDANLPVPPLTGLIGGYLGLPDRVVLDAVIITHWHPDHSGGISGLAGATATHAHRRTRAHLLEGAEGIDLVQPGSRFVSPPRPPGEVPGRTVDDSLVLPRRSETISAVHQPHAHTDGDLVVWFDSADVVAMGDLYWPGAFPSIDIHNGGGVAGLLAAVDAVLTRATADTRFISGHGPVTDRKEMERYRAMLHTTLDEVRNRVAAGEGLPGLLESGLNADWSSWATPLVPEAQWIRFLHHQVVPG